MSTQPTAPDREPEDGEVVRLDSNAANSTTQDRLLQSGDGSEAHDEFCESEFIEGPNAYSPCACDVRAEIPADVREWLDETYLPEGVAIWMRSYRDACGDCGSVEAHRAKLIRMARTPSGGT